MRWVLLRRSFRSSRPTPHTRRSIVTHDRKDPGRYLIIVFFDSYESAMENSELPETQQFAEKWIGAVDSMTFHDLDVLDL